VLVNNAGIVRFAPIARRAGGLRQVIDINLTGTYLGMPRVVSSMRRRAAARLSIPPRRRRMIGQFGLGSYVASKWGVRG